MPTYEYECLSCGHCFEVFQMMTDKPITICPKCRKAVRRVIGTGSGIIFKGAGFYATDYRKNKTQPVTKPESEQKTPKQDSKPQDNKPQYTKPKDNKPEKKEISGAKDRKSK